MSGVAAGLGAWAAVYLGYDDAALATLASPGLVRRARKDVAAGRVEPVEARPDGVAVSVGGMQVELDAGGPAEARCACPTPGACQHVVAASLWVREAGSAPAETPAVAGDGAAASAPTPDPVAEILALDPRVVHRAAGAAVVRAVAETTPRPPAGATVDGLPTEAAVGGPPVEVVVDGPRAVVSWPGAPRVTYVAGAGFAGMLVAREGTAWSDAEERRWRLEALAHVWRAHDRPWPWPERAATAPVPRASRRHERWPTRSCARSSGCSTPGSRTWADDDLEELRGAGVVARLGRRPAVQRLVTSAVGRLEALVDRRGAVDETDCLLALAELWAYVQADPPPDAGTPDERTTDLARVVPLGARWWVAASGARGVTVHLWDADAGRVRSVTTGRPPGADPTFRRSWDLPLVWGRSVEALCRGPFALRGATERAGTGLRAGEGPAVEPLGVLDADELRDVAARTATTPPRAEAGFGRTPAVVRVVMVREAGAIGLDEVAQELTWTLVAADGAETVVRVDAADEAACDTLLGVAAGSRRVVAVAVERDLASRRDEAVGLFVDRPGEGLDVVVPTLTPAYDHRAWSTPWARLRARVRSLRGRAVTHARDVVVPTPVEDVCDTLLDSVVALAATGRRHLTPHQASALARAARTADDLGATTLATTVGLVAHAPDAAGLLRAGFVAARGRTLARAVAAAPAPGPRAREAGA